MDVRRSRGIRHCVDSECVGDCRCGVLRHREVACIEEVERGRETEGGREAGRGRGREKGEGKGSGEVKEISLSGERGGAREERGGEGEWGERERVVRACVL